jgi:hypothetical protein
MKQAQPQIDSARRLLVSARMGVQKRLLSRVGLLGSDFMGGDGLPLGLCSQRVTASVHQTHALR